MNGAISSLRILPAETDASALQPADASEPGFRDVLHSAIDDIQQLEGQAETKVAGVLTGNGADVHSAHDRSREGRSKFSTHDAGAEQNCVRVRRNLAHAVLGDLPTIFVSPIFMSTIWSRDF